MMRVNLRLACVVFGSAVLTASMTWAETAKETFTQGEDLLKKGNFAAALDTYAAAARAEPGNQEYIQHYAMVRRVIDMRKRLDQEQDLQQWEYLARALRAFYVNERIYSEALAVDQKIHGRLNNAVSAAMLAETQLAMEMNAEAVKTLSTLGPERANPATQALLGVAMVRNGQKEQARQVASSFSLPGDAGPGATYAAARLYAAVGDSSKAVELLAKCLESVPPSLQEGFRVHAKLAPEFAAMVSGSEFARALETPSKVPESKCSGGRSCAGCPMRGNCAHGQAR